MEDTKKICTYLTVKHYSISDVYYCYKLDRFVTLDKCKTSSKCDYRKIEKEKRI